MTLKKRKSKPIKKQIEKIPFKKMKAPKEDDFLSELEESPLLDDPLKDDEVTPVSDDETN